MTEFRAPLSLPPSAADEIDAKTREMVRWKRLAESIMGILVVGARGQQINVAEAQERANGYRDAIEREETEGSHRHRRVSLPARLIVLMLVVVVDVPLMFVIASAVFNVDWSAV